MNAFVRIQGSTHLCECYARHICSEPSSLVSMKDNRVCDPSDDEDRVGRVRTLIKIQSKFGGLILIFSLFTPGLEDQRHHLR